MANTLKTTLDASQVTIYDEAVRVSGLAFDTVDRFATINLSINGAGVEFTYYSKLTKQTSALTDGTEATAEAMADSKVTITPAEYGNVITTTRLANTSTAGKADLGAGRLVGINMIESRNAKALAVLEAGTNATASGTIGTLAKTDLRTAYQKLAGKGIPKFSDGRYVAFINPAQISDIKDDYITIAQNTNLGEAVNGMVGTLEGFTIIEDPTVTAGTVVTMGVDGLGKAVALESGATIIDGTDNLGRTRHYGWYGIYEYGIIDNNAVEVITGA